MAALSTEAENTYRLNTNSGDRFGFGFFVALAAHLILIFGVVFEWVDAQENHSELDVTLVTHYSELEPDEADFLAQMNQEASGTKDQVLVPTSPTPESRSDMQGEQGKQSVSQFRQIAGDFDSQILTSTKSLDALASNQQGEFSQDLIQESASMSSKQSMLARLDMLQQDYAKRPKVGTLTSVAAKAREDAEYQIHLQEKVIEVGNQNYPQESLQQDVYGSLRLMLSVLPDGTLEETEIIESSGHQLLDRAAIRIARLSAPFQPFPKELSAKYDKIVFIRTWQFLPGGLLATDQ